MTTLISSLLLFWTLASQLTSSVARPTLCPNTTGNCSNIDPNAGYPYELELNQVHTNIKLRLQAHGSRLLYLLLRPLLASGASVEVVNETRGKFKPKKYFKKWLKKKKKLHHRVTQDLLEEVTSSRYVLKNSPKKGSESSNEATTASSDLKTSEKKLSDGAHGVEEVKETGHKNHLIGGSKSFDVAKVGLDVVELTDSTTSPEASSILISVADQEHFTKTHEAIGGEENSSTQPTSTVLHFHKDEHPAVFMHIPKSESPLKFADIFSFQRGRSDHGKSSTYLPLGKLFAMQARPMDANQGNKAMQVSRDMNSNPESKIRDGVNHVTSFSTTTSGHWQAAAGRLKSTEDLRATTSTLFYHHPRNKGPKVTPKIVSNDAFVTVVSFAEEGENKKKLNKVEELKNDFITLFAHYSSQAKRPGVQYRNDSPNSAHETSSVNETETFLVYLKDNYPEFYSLFQRNGLGNFKIVGLKSDGDDLKESESSGLDSSKGGDLEETERSGSSGSDLSNSKNPKTEKDLKEPKGLESSDSGTSDLKEDRNPNAKGDLEETKGSKSSGPDWSNLKEDKNPTAEEDLEETKGSESSGPDSRTSKEEENPRAEEDLEEPRESESSGPDSRNLNKEENPTTEESLEETEGSESSGADSSNSNEEENPTTEEDLEETEGSGSPDPDSSNLDEDKNPTAEKDLEETNRSGGSGSDASNSKEDKNPKAEEDLEETQGSGSPDPNSSNSKEDKHPTAEEDSEETEGSEGSDTTSGNLEEDKNPTAEEDLEETQGSGSPDPDSSNLDEDKNPTAEEDLEDTQGTGSPNPDSSNIEEDKNPTAEEDLEETRGSENYGSDSSNLKPGKNPTAEKDLTETKKLGSSGSGTSDLTGGDLEETERSESSGSNSSNLEVRKNPTAKEDLEETKQSGSSVSDSRDSKERKNPKAEGDSEEAKRSGNSDSDSDALKKHKDGKVERNLEETKRPGSPGSDSSTNPKAKETEGNQDDETIDSDQDSVQLDKPKKSAKPILSAADDRNKNEYKGNKDRANGGEELKSRLQISQNVNPKNQNALRLHVTEPTPPGHILKQLRVTNLYVFERWGDRDDELLDLNNLPKELCDRMHAGLQVENGRTQEKKK